VAVAIEEHEAKNAELVTALLDIDLVSLSDNTDLNRYAIARGASVFRAQCSQCHGAGAAGGKGYPNLLDDDWLWGGAIDEIAYTVSHGIRNETDGDARFSMMPVFGEMLETPEITSLVEYVTSLTNPEHDAALAATGSELFVENCAACHGDDAKGNRDLGAPNLADAIWLYGGDRATLTETITYSRYGIMPAWGQRLKEVDVRAVSAYVHALGGGE
jgi:cytochrome c oxidase cbb3-type subunit 3